MSCGVAKADVELGALMSCEVARADVEWGELEVQLNQGQHVRYLSRRPACSSESNLCRDEVATVPCGNSEFPFISRTRHY